MSLLRCQTNGKEGHTDCCLDELHPRKDDEVLSIEKELVSTLARFSYPPSASTFCLIFLSGFPTSSSSSLPLIADTSQFMIELASCDFFFVAHKQSKIALAAIIVTLEQLQVDTSSELIQSWLTKIKRVVGGDDDSSNTDDLELMACSNNCVTFIATMILVSKPWTVKKERITPNQPPKSRRRMRDLRIVCHPHQKMMISLLCQKKLLLPLLVVIISLPAYPIELK